MGGDTLMSVYPSQILINLTMLQSFIGIGDVDGVYWTLAYEISFYAAVFVFLLFGLQKSLKSLFIAWPFLMCAALLLGLQSFPYLGGYYYYFAAGALLAIIKEDASFKPITALLIAFALCLSFSTGSAAYLTEHKGFHYSPYVIGILISVFFALFILQNTKKAQAVRLPGSRTAGALTYPVYLIHAHFGYMFINQFATNENKILVYSLAASIVIFIGYLMHKVIEERLSSLWKWLFDSTLGELVSFLQSALLGIQTAYNKSLKRAQ
jgi:peptidoglycan/LPS O-acetylase OafA/YrhL